MTFRLPSSTIERIEPLLSSLARIIATGTFPSDASLQKLLAQLELEYDADVLAELKRWRDLLVSLEQDPSEEQKQTTIEALSLRGLPDAPVRLAVAQVSAPELFDPAETVEFGRPYSPESLNASIDILNLHR